MQIEKNKEGHVFLVFKKEKKQESMGKMIVALCALMSIGLVVWVGLGGNGLNPLLSMVLAIAVLCVGLSLILGLRQKEEREILKLEETRWSWEMTQKGLFWGGGDIKDFKLKPFQQDKTFQLWLRSGERATLIGEHLKKEEKQRVLEVVHEWAKKFDEGYVQHLAEDMIKRLKRD